jgi:hypothetical protein
MKYTSILLIAFSLIHTSLQAQKEERPSYRNYLERGTKAVNVQIGVAGEYPINSVTALDISKNNKRYGLLALPSYGLFIERNFMIGASAIIGFNYNSYTYNSLDYSTNPPRPAEYKSESKGSDFGLAPFMRYYVPLGKRNVVSLFGQGSFPVLYSNYSSSSVTNSQGFNNYRFEEEGLKLMATLGLGVSLNGRFGSFEINANNTGLYVGFQKYLFAKKK